MLALTGWWYLCLLVPTLIFKYRYLSVLYVEDFGHAVFSRAPGAGPLYIIRWFASDALSVLAAVVVLFGVARLVRLRLGIVASVSIVLAFVVATFNEIALEFTQQLLSWSNFRDGLDWTLQHAGLVVGSLDAHLFQIVLWAFACSLIPVVASRQAIGRARVVLLCLMPWIVILSCVVIALASLIREFSCEDCRIQGASYWHSTFRALRGPRQLISDERVLPSISALLAQRDSLFYPGQDPRSSDSTIPVDQERIRPRHLVVVILETAPRKYYDLTNDRTLPTFQRLSRNALISNTHYSAAPTTRLAVQALLGGTYPPLGAVLGDLGRPDGLGNVLRAQGYETTFIDSYNVDWVHGSTAGQSLTSLGFDRVESILAQGVASEPTLAASLYRERAALRRAEKSVIEADRRGKHALVVVATSVGHWPWPHQSADSGVTARRELHSTAEALDGVVGETLLRLDKAGIRDQLMILVTGDHGLRFGAEFESLAEARASTEVAFNVPFLLYAPGLFTRQVVVPQATSHVDVTPTLLALNGFSSAGMMHHGESMLNSRLIHRVTFMFGYDVNPFDRYLWENCVVTVNTMTGMKSVHSVSPSACESGERPLASSFLSRARALFASTAALGLKRTTR